MAGNNLPPPQSAFVDKTTGILSYDGYQFLLDLLSNALSGLTQQSVSLNLSARGNSQATALLLPSQWNVVSSSIFPNNGALLAAYQPGEMQAVFNQSGGNVNIYPPPGGQIDALGDNVFYALAAGKMQIFNFVSSSQIESTQLG